MSTLLKFEGNFGKVITLDAHKIAGVIASSAGTAVIEYGKSPALSYFGVKDRSVYEVQQAVSGIQRMYPKPQPTEKPIKATVTLDDYTAVSS